MSRTEFIRRHLRHLDPGDWRMFRPALLGCESTEQARSAIYQAGKALRGPGQFTTREEAGFIRATRTR